MHAHPRRPVLAILTIAQLGTAAGALAQATQRAAFVANNGNVEGSITSFTFSASGEPVFVSRTITGTAPSSSTPNAGTNPYAISLPRMARGWPPATPPVRPRSSA